MELHGNSRVSEIGALQVSWNFMFFPWNCSCQRNWRTLSSMEFHGTARVIEIGALLVPWNSMNSMELLASAKLAHSKFHGIPWNFSCQRNWRTPSSMEFYGIPWIFSCQRNWRTSSSMEFHGIPWNCSCQRNWRTLSSMEFHAARVSEIGAL